MKVLAVASECFPWIKTGGLADVVGALPAALAPEGVAVRTLIPGYPAVLAAMDDAQDVLAVAEIYGGPARVLAFGDMLVLHAPHLFDRPGNPYVGPDGRDWPDNLDRFAALSRVAADIGGGALAGWQPDVVHAHDWQAGLAMADLAFSPARPATVLTVHNLAFQGRFPASAFDRLGLPDRARGVAGLEFFGGISTLKAGLVYADRVTTVSPTYAAEIGTPEHGQLLDGVLRARPDAVHGILNGIDTQDWDPATDTALAATFTPRTLPRRATNRRALLARFGLADAAGPLFAVVSRLTWQKGLDLLLAALPRLLEADGRLVVLGSGEPALEAAFAAAAAAHPGRVGCIIGYDEALAHLVQGGADALLVPSRFEPCGLTQLCALRYGCTPVVARVGGLADTVIDANPAALAAGVATGVQFAPVDADGLAGAVDRAVTLFAQPAVWQRMQRRAMAADVSWRLPARAYAELFRAVARR